MSFAISHQNKNREGCSKMSISAKSSHHINNSMRNSHDSIIHLQHTIGNQAVQRLLSTNVPFNFAKIDIQPKLKVSQPGDVYEQEADRIADQVMGMSTGHSVTSTTTPANDEERIDRKCATCEMKEEDKEEDEHLSISRKQSTASNLETTDGTANEIINVHTNGGSPLDGDTREFMESRFGYDFSLVRIHTDKQAAESAEAVNAL